MAKWNILDHLKLEMLVHRHRNLVASGQKVSEDEANRTLLKSTSKEGEGREERLKAWSASKWEQLIKIDKRLSYVDRMQWVPLITCSAALVFAILTLIPNVGRRLVGDRITLIDVNAFLGIYVLLPFALLLSFFIWSLIRNAKHDVFEPLVKFCKRVTRGAQKANTQIHNIHATGRRDDRNASFFQPVLWAYTWCVKTVFSGFRSKGTKLRDDSAPETHLPIGEALSQALMQQRSTLRLWSQRNLHLFGATYFLMFLLFFFGATKFRSLAFEWEQTDKGAEVTLSDTNRFTIVGAPWSHLVDLPTTEQINSTKRYSGDAFNVNKAAWYAWSLYCMMAIVVYGVLPRTVLIIIQSLWLRHKLNSPDFSALRYESLIRGMRESPLLPPTIPEPAPPGPPPAPVPDPKSKGIRFCVIADCSLVEGSFRDDFSVFLNKRFEVEQDGSTVWMTLDSTPMDKEQFKGKLNQLLKSMLPLRAGDRILHLVDSGQSPKANYQTRTKRIRETVGDEVGIIYMLMHDDVEFAEGKESSESFRLWSQKTRDWRDSNLEIEEFYQGGQNI